MLPEAVYLIKFKYNQKLTLKFTEYGTFEQVMSLAPDGWLDVAGASLEYRIVGPLPEQAPTIILLHEGLGCVGRWKDFPERLASLTGFGVFVYSRRGYGQSSPYPPPWPVQYMHDEAEILRGVLVRLDIQAGILCGHSDGASIAAIFLGNTGHPGVKGLVLMAPHFFTEQAGLDSIQQAKSEYQQGNLRERLKKYHGDNVDNAFLGWNGAWLQEGFAAWNIESVLPHICIPILVLQGMQDQYGSIAQVKTVQQNAGGDVRLTMLEHCGHSPHVDQGTLVLAEIHDFSSGILE